MPTSKKLLSVFKFLFLFLLFLLCGVVSLQAQIPTNNGFGENSIALAPARIELEMKPGSEATVVINLDYRSSDGASKPARIAASLNDWSISGDGQIEFFKPGSKPNSAASWIVYSPAETIVTPGNVHSIRVTVSVPFDAAPGDHLAALAVEQRPETLKFNRGADRQMIVRYRMASIFYIKVGQLTRRGSLENLEAKTTEKGIIVTPTLKNSGNSAVRPTAAVRIVDADGKPVAELPQIEPLPVLGNSTNSQPLLIDKRLPPGVYTVRYSVDFQDGSAPTEGVADLLVRAPQKKTPQIAAGKTADKP